MGAVHLSLGPSAGEGAFFQNKMRCFPPRRFPILKDPFLATDPFIGERCVDRLRPPQAVNTCSFDMRQCPMFHDIYENPGPELCDERPDHHEENNRQVLRR